MKFQHLILPLVLWLFAGLIITYSTPDSPLIIGGMFFLLCLALYFSVRLITHSNIPTVVACCSAIFLLTSMVSGFSLINLLLIAAIGILISQLTT